MDLPKTRFATVVIIPIATAFFLLEFLPAFGETYGYFLDELYYLACARRLAFGYVDHPPLAPLILRANIEILGASIPALRFLPALAGGLTIFLAGWMAHRMGGGTFAQTIAALSVVVAPIPLIIFGFFSMNCFEILLWAIACWLVLEISRSGDERLWVPLGVALGLAFENKHTATLLIAGVGVATLLTPLREHLLGRRLWIGALVAALIALPNLGWQIQNGWPSLEFYRNLEVESNIPTPPLEIFAGQIGVMNPVTFPVWFAGTIFLFATPQYRPLGWVFLTPLVSFTFSGLSRPDRIVGGYPVAFAAGGVLLESLGTGPWLRWLRYALPTLLIAGGILVAPVTLPFPPEIMERHPAAASSGELRREVGTSRIPLPFAHRIGWKEFVEQVAGVYQGLDPGEQREAAILVDDFGHAGALEFFGPAYRLPTIYSPHNHYYLWGPEPGTSPQFLIAIAIDQKTLRTAYREVERVAIYKCTYCMGWRSNVPIYVARSPQRPLSTLWPEMRRFGLPGRKLRLLDTIDPE